MAIALKGSVVETFDATEQSPHTINLPTGLVVGDILLLAVNHSPDGTATIGTVTTPSGWTEVGTSTETGAASNSRLTLFGRTVGASEPTTVDIATSTSMAMGAVAVAYSGVDTGAIFDVATPSFATGTGDATCPTLTTVTDGAMVLRIAIADGTASPIQDGDIPAGTTLRGAMDNSPPSNGMSLGYADEIQATAGASGTAAWGNGGSEEYVAATVAFRPLADITISTLSSHIDDNETGVVVTGTGFEASQGTGVVEMGDNAVYGSANLVEQTVTSWADTSITFTADLGAQSPTDKWLYVTNDTGTVTDGEPYVARREKAIGLALSANIAASGADTTAQLTAPSGKTTGDFGGGRIQDDENPGDDVNVALAEYREDEWCIEALAASVDGETYQFRVVFDGDFADTVTVTPELTIADAVDVSGAVSGPASTVAGTAVLAHGASGALVAPAALASGDLTLGHPLTGALAAPASTLAGTAILDHDVSGGVSAPSAELSGSASLVQSVSGALAAPAPDLSGSLALGHPLSGALVAPSVAASGSLVLGHPLSGGVSAPAFEVSAALVLGHPLSGALVAPSPTATGSVETLSVSGALVTPTASVSASTTLVHALSGAPASPVPTVAAGLTLGHPLTGALTAPSATSTGAAILDHAVTGALAGPAATLAGTITVPSDSVQVSGVVIAPAGTLAGTAVIDHAVSGALLGAAPTVSGGFTLGHPVSGTIVAPAPSVVAPLTLEHVVSGVIVGPSATLTGAASSAQSTAGAVTAPVGTFAGTILVVATVGGSLAAPAPTLSSSSILDHAVSGGLTAAAATVTGEASVGARQVSGALTPPAPTVSADMAIQHSVSGGLTAPSPTVAGSARVFATIEAAPTAPASTIAGLLTLERTVSGSLAAPAPQTAGSITSIIFDNVLRIQMATTSAASCRTTMKPALKCVTALTPALKCVIVTS